MKGGLSEATIVIAGHTDNRGRSEYNRALSERRSQAVRHYLVAKHGIAAERLIVKAYGEDKPLTSNDTENDRAMNRRVEFIRVGGF